MHLKTFLLPVIMMVSAAAYAQDKIYKTDGEVIDAKIKSVGTKTVTYVRFDNQTGPEYTIVKNEVEKIAYQNGSVDVFETGGLPRPGHHHHHINKPEGNTDNGPAEPKIKYKPDVLALAPIQFTENGLGVALSYERAIDKDGIVAFYLPVIATWNLSNSTYIDNNTGQTVNGHADMMAYAMPGIKIYPTGSYGVVRYSVGPSLVIGAGQRSNQIYDPYSNPTSQYVTQQHFVLGIMVNNSLNINPSPHVYLGLDFGFGFTYMDRIAGLNQNTSGLVQGGFKIGYRF